MKTICQGAEAIISLSDNTVTKDRIPKTYRLKELDDKIRKRRTKSETKLLEKASKIINSPSPLTPPSQGRMGGNTPTKIQMPFIKGQKLSEHLDSFPLSKQKQICKKIGESIAKLHNEDIIHGDLTTSNMILQDNKVFFIDFGLGFISHKYEDKAVDLHLLKQAFEAKHFKHWETLVKEVFNSYIKGREGGNAKIVLERLKAVEKRGRYKNK